MPEFEVRFGVVFSLRTGKQQIESISISIGVVVVLHIKQKAIQLTASKWDSTAYMRQSSTLDIKYELRNVKSGFLMIKAYVGHDVLCYSRPIQSSLNHLHRSIAS